MKTEVVQDILAGDDNRSNLTTQVLLAGMSFIIPVIFHNKFFERA